MNLEKLCCNTAQLDLLKMWWKETVGLLRASPSHPECQLKLAVMSGVTPDLTKGGEVNKLASSIRHWLQLSSSRGRGLSANLSVSSVCVLFLFIPFLISWHWKICSCTAKVSEKVERLYRQTVVPTIKPICQEHGSPWNHGELQCIILIRL